MNTKSTVTKAQIASISELLPLISNITIEGNFLRFIPNLPTSHGTNVLKRKLELMGIMDIPIVHSTYVEVDYRFARPAQHNLLSDIKALFDVRKAQLANNQIRANERIR